MNEFGDCITPLLRVNSALKHRRWSAAKEQIKVLNTALKRLERRHDGEIPRLIKVLRRNELGLESLTREIHRGRVGLEITVDVREEGDVLKGILPEIQVVGMQIKICN